MRYMQPPTGTTWRLTELLVIMGLNASIKAVRNLKVYLSKVQTAIETIRHRIFAQVCTTLSRL